LARSEALVRVLGFGDSLTAGTPGYDPFDLSGDERSQYGYWLVRKAKQEDGIDMDFDNQGVPGELARHMLPRLRKTMNQRSYDVAIILAGSNDVGWGSDSKTVWSYVKSLWEHALDRGSHVVGCTIPPVGFLYPGLQETQTSLNEMICASAKDYDNLMVVDLFVSLSDEKGILVPQFNSGDALHLSIEGYRRMGEVIWQGALGPLLSSTIPHDASCSDKTPM
jgi:lysophospholipase L1-like esterase